MPLFEYSLGHLDVNADDRPINQLCDGDVASDTHQLVRLMFRQVPGARQEIDHLLNRQRRRRLEIGVGGHADEIGRRLRSRP